MLGPLSRRPVFNSTRRQSIYAIIRAGGRQYRVRPEQTLQIDRLATEAGATVEFREVLLIGDNGGTQVGNPFVEGARVIAEVLEQGRDAKLLVFKYKNKTRYRRRHGHRQGFTRLAIRQILMAGQEPGAEGDGEKPARPARKRAAPKRKPEPAATADTAPEEAVTEAIATEAAPPGTATKPRRASRPRKAAAQAGGSAEAEAKPKRAVRARRAPPEADGAPQAEAAEAPKPARRPRTKKTNSGE